MNKIEGIHYFHKDKKNLDLSDVNIVRFNIDELNYIDVQFKNGKVDTLYINGSSSISIMPTASNCVEIKIRSEFQTTLKDWY